METNCGASDFWENRYLSNNIGWDLGECSPPIQNYFTKNSIDKNVEILIPGAGNAYEAAYLFRIGYKNVHVLDFALQPLEDFKSRNPEFPSNQLHHEDFFKHEGNYDYIIEQTFFCALPPTMREAYAKKMSQLLKKNGLLVGILFNRNFEDGPPFGGSEKGYINLFSRYFNRVEIYPCIDSIAPRMGSEVFIQLAEPNNLSSILKSSSD